MVERQAIRASVLIFSLCKVTRDVMGNTSVQGNCGYGRSGKSSPRDKEENRNGLRHHIQTGDLAVGLVLLPPYEL